MPGFSGGSFVLLGGGVQAGAGDVTVPATMTPQLFFLLSRSPVVSPPVTLATMPASYFFLLSTPAVPPVPLPYDLVDALVAHTRANLPSSTLPGGTHYDWAGPTADGTERPLPYVDVVRVSESRSYQSDENYIATGMLQASVFGRTRLSAAMAADRMSATLKQSPLQFQTGRLMYFAESDLRGGKDPDPGTGGGVVYQEMRMFSYVYHSTL